MDQQKKQQVLSLIKSKHEVEAIAPLTTTQRDLYLDSLKNPRGIGHQVVLYGVIDQQIDVALWQESLTGFIYENPILRTKLFSFEDEIYQYVEKEHEPVFSFIDCQDLHKMGKSIKEIIAAMDIPDQDLSHPLVHHYLIKIHDHCYVTLFRIHHVLIDGYCGKLYVEKITKHYFSSIRSSLKERVADFAFFDYVPIHNQLFDQPSTLEFWREKLRSVNTMDKHQGISAKDIVQVDVEVIPEAHYECVKAYCHENGIQQSDYWFAVLALVYKYQFDVNGDFCLRTFAGGRRVRQGQDFHEFGDTLGCFYHIIPTPFYTDFFGQDFLNLANSIASQRRSLGENRFISMMAQNNILPKEALTVYYNYQPFWDIEIDGKHSFFEERYHEMGSHIELRVAYTHHQLELHLDYNKKYFNGTNFLKRIAKISEQLLKGIHINSLEYLLTEESALFDTLNPGEHIQIPKHTFPEALATTLKSNPEKVAIREEDCHISYANLDKFSDRFACHLQQEYRIKKGDVVVLMMNRSWLMVTSILAIWKASGVYLPVSPGLPLERIGKILKQATPKVILCEDALSKKLVQVVDDCSFISQASTEALMRGDAHLQVSGYPLPDDLAYILFTSGSSGIPKGACIEHKGMMNHMLAKQELLSINRQDKIAQNASASFDISVWQMFNALLEGGETCIYSDEVVLDVEKFLSSVSAQGITILEVVPSYLKLMLDSFETTSISAISNLRYLMVTGEEIKPDLAKRWYDMFPDVPLVNAYGPTEASDDITHHIIQKPVSDERIPIGRPIRNMNIHILNEQGQMCGIHMKGEICVSGVGVGRGYLNDREATEKAFVKDPWYPSLNMYRTGDIGRWLPDGTIDFLGRRDNQVKLRGYRIELSDIELAIEANSLIEQAVVMVVDEEGNPTLCCYYVATAEVPAEQLSAGARRTLPAYMVPTHFLLLKEFPLTAHGKIDKKALPPLQVQSTKTEQTTNYQHENPVVHLWSEILKVGQCSLEDHFFEQGGDSIKAMRLMNRLKNELGISVPVHTIFHHPRLNDFINSLPEATNTDGTEDTLPSISKAEEREHYPLSFSQKRLLLTEKTTTANSAYVMVAAYRLKGTINHVAFSRAIEQLVSRHEILRVSFGEANGEMRQYFKPEVPLVLEQIKLTNSEHPENELSGILIAEAEHPFELHEGPLFRVKLIEFSPDHHVFVYSVHHLLTDGWSKGVIFNTLAEGYNLALDDEHSSLPTLKIQYKDYCSWQQEVISTPQMSAQSNYWKRILSQHIPRTTFPLDFSRPEKRSYQGHTISYTIDERTTRQLKESSAKCDATLFHLVITALNTLIYKYTGNSSTIIGTSVSGRTSKELEDQVGFYVNTLPLLNTVNVSRTLKSEIASVSKNAIEAFAHQDYPFMLMLEEIDTSNLKSLWDIISVYVEFHNYQRGEPVAFRGLEATVIREHHVKALFDIEFNFELKNDKLLLHLIYDKSLFRYETANLFGTSLVQLLEFIPESLMETVEAFAHLGREVGDSSIENTSIASSFDHQFDF